MSFRPTSAPDFGRVEWANADGSEGADLAGCELYAIWQAGREVAHIALRRLSPRCVEVTALQGAGLAGELWQQIEAHITAEQLQCVTAKAGIVRLLEREGWRCVGHIMTKEKPHGRAQ